MKRKQSYLIQSTLMTKADQQRFEALVQESGLSKAEYIRRCCLEPVVTLVPDANLKLYGEMGALQITLKRLVSTTPTPELVTALAQVQSLRLTLVGLLESMQQTEHPTA